MKKTNKKRNGKGFTLIELMVATSIFVVVMLASMSSLFILLNAAKNSKALRFAMDNVNFAMESMSRSIRMGTNYYCGADIPSDPNVTQDCAGGGTLISFIPQNGSTRVGYKISTRSDGTQTLQRCDTSNGCVDIVSSKVNITKLNFFVKGSSPLDLVQPSIYITIKGTVVVKGIPSSFALQTLASQRNY